MTRFRLILGTLVLIVSCWTTSAEAACTGSGLVWTCTAGSSAANIQSAYSSGTDGMTITLAAGSYSFTSGVNFAMNKAVTLICASVGACTVTGSGILGMNGNCAGTSTKLYRISGFVFSGGSNRIWFNAFNTPPCTLTSIRIDHNTFTGQSGDSRIIQFGDNSNNSYFYGVIDHNTVTNVNNVLLAEFYSSNGSTAPAGTRGTASNMFFEDNTITITTMDNPGAGCIDSTGSPGIVWRHNTTTNCLLTAHGTTGGGGIVNYEIYGNRFIVNAGANSSYQDCERCFHHQGSGETLFFDNQFTAFLGKDNGAIAMTHYRSASPATAGYSGVQCNGTAPGDGNRSPTSTYYGYPCKRQPGRDVNGGLQPMYIWQNRWSDTGVKLDMKIENPWGQSNPSVHDHIKPERDFYNAVSNAAQTSPTSPFNGTTGMGFGTLANRPATCTTNALEPGGGVGYFATDQGPLGTLYRCAGTNTWTVHYTPYTYPHPLTAGSQPSAPSAPTNLRIQTS